MKRRYLLFGLAAVALIIFLVWLANFLTVGKLVVTTASPYATITLTQPDDQQFSKQLSTGKTLSLHTGQYIVSVKSTSLATDQLIKVSAHKTLHLSINPVQPSGVEPVINVSATSLAANASSLLYLDSASQNLYKIDGQNNISVLNPNIQFISLRWASASFGVGQDTAGNLYAIVGGQAQKLNLPASAGNYTVSPDNKIYFSSGQALYMSGANYKFTKLYQAKQPFASLAAFKGGVTIFNSLQADSTSQSPVYAMTIFNSGKTLDKDIQLGSSSVWSPSGRYLASAGNQTYQLLDSSLKKVADLPGSSISNLVWQSDNTLLYSSKDQLWTFDVPTHKASLLATMPLGGVILQSALSDDKSYVYVTISDPINGGSIKRVGLNNQVVPAYLYQLQSVLPESLGECTLSLLNFSQPTVLVKSLPESPSDNSCLTTATNDLSQKGFDLHKLQLRLTN